MTRAPRHKISRRFGVDLHGTGGASLRNRLGTPPGGVKQGRRRRESVYGAQLAEKQKARAIYGVRERQFRRYYAEASRGQGAPGENLLILLERRLDNVVYRLGWARTRPMARQLVNHGHVRVDGRRVDIPSFLVEARHRVELTEGAARIPAVADEMNAGRPLPAWLERDGERAGRVVRLPQRADIDVPVDEAQIVGYYSR
ncbi:MAG TPA: 30S ribosomal protein S4 [candidate division Zixibacteria bacterium]|nr:30S ribosomal protein S4 [candidate division Zixibacteria bacterium]